MTKKSKEVLERIKSEAIRDWELRQEEAVKEGEKETIEGIESTIREIKKWTSFDEVLDWLRSEDSFFEDDRDIVDYLVGILKSL